MAFRRKRRRGFFVGRLPVWVRFSGQQIVRFLLVLLGAALLFLGWRFSTVWNDRYWYGYEPYRILVLSDKESAALSSVELISIWPDTMKSLSIYIPPDAVISSVGGYGNFRIASLLELGAVEGVGERLLKDSLSYTLGVPIHQVYVSKQHDLRQAWVPIFREALVGQRSFPEATSIIQLLQTVRNGVTEKIVLSEKNVLRQRTDIDGSLSTYFEPALTDRFMQNTARTLWREAAMLQVAVINASGKPTMAASWSRFPRIAGFDVVSVTDQQEMHDQTMIIFSDEETMNAPIGKVLSFLFPLAKRSVGEVGAYRAQTVVILGSDSWRYLTDRLTYLDTH